MMASKTIKKITGMETEIIISSDEKEGGKGNQSMGQNETCATNVSFEDGSCIDVKVLVEMAKAYNKEFPNDPIKYKDLGELDSHKFKKTLVKQFTNRLSGKCMNHKCWSKQSFVKRMEETYKAILENFTFAPEGPKGRTEWLNTLHINEVMLQDMFSTDKIKLTKGGITLDDKDLMSDFLFLGAVPLDFEDKEVDEYIHDINFSEIEKDGKHKIGLIINHEPHTMGGSHWVAIYSDLQKGGVYYFDSYGEEPLEEIEHFMHKIGKYIEHKKGIKPDIRYNENRNQYKGSECGVYSINFIKRMLMTGGDFDKVTNEVISDDEVNLCRSKYFYNNVTEKLAKNVPTDKLNEMCGIVQS
jgi:hypothetical protein